MTNMIFMPFGGHCLEIRPRDYDNQAHHNLAEVCELHFYVVYGNGTKETSTSVSVSSVVETLEMIKGRMDEEDKEMDMSR